MKQPLGSASAVRIPLLAGIVFASLALAGGAGAVAPKITETFDAGAQGWEIYEGTSEYDATWQASGGNPGGFVRYSDLGAASSDAVFADEEYVSHISRYEGGRILFDLRSDAGDPAAPTVTITDPDDYAFPAIHTRARHAPGLEWTSYAIPVETAATVWRDESGKRVGEKRFAAILGRDPVYEIQADLSASAAETTDLDNVGIINAAPRTLSLTYSAKKGKLKGTLKCPTDANCIAGETVTIVRRKKGPDEKLGKATTSTAGRYSLKRKHLKKGSYVASVAQTNPEVGTLCAAAKSPVLERK
jgi:hypothetical protein